MNDHWPVPPDQDNLDQCPVHALYNSRSIIAGTRLWYHLFMWIFLMLSTLYVPCNENAALMQREAIRSRRAPHPVSG